MKKMLMGYVHALSEVSPNRAKQIFLLTAKILKRQGGSYKRKIFK